MKYNNPDAFAEESETEYETRKSVESQSATGFMFGIGVLLFLAFKIAVIFGIYFYAGFMLSKKLCGEDTGQFRIWALTLLFTYLIFCIIYFFKGIVIGLRAKKSNLWIVPWAVCILVCCIAPAFIVKSFVATMLNLKEKQDLAYSVISWFVFVLSAIYIYGIYRFRTADAPRLLYWSYAFGLRVSL
ncbi:hypothetical protein IR010_03050 [Flavobacterium sp. MR2016-29]|uniref:hypothetical protein n=1 Tax=Flavobacterium sp. MR2016-29 TaxID=2783795 RepID=UPI00188AF86A|nr:hypothetical protein [Flavobacterium sp. MR2016-29]MBF4491503.1 hypothetical protein [Flavobacterium sp. MR2016-29]